MDHDFVKGLVALLERSSLTVIDYIDGDQQIRLVRNHRETDPSGRIPTGQSELRPAPSVVAGNHVPDASVPHRHTIHAGLVGTFYRAPGPNRPPFAIPGDRITAGTTLGLVEAMKLLNPIEADRDGRLAEVLVSDGASVSRDTPLFVIEPV